ncbi:DUF2510 domain-containing protein [Arthrobacter sp. NPDC093128]|uniref:DUF2510 domain-containing protein n=1 Tax=Arthrobacter sp. NPDC093128 TaxID=3154979 RepID=UPI0034425666
MAQPPGWYSDPNVPGQQRWWDGHAWTQQVRPLQMTADRPELPDHDPSTSTIKPAGHGFLRRLGASTYVAVGLLGLLLIPFAASGGFFIWFVLAVFVVLLTGLYTLVTGRRSWAHIAGRRVGAIVVGASVVSLFASMVVVGATAPVSTKNPVVPTPEVAAPPPITAPATPTATSIPVTPTPTPSDFPSPTAQPEPTSAAPDITATPIAPPAQETPTASVQPTTASPSAEATKDASDFAAKYTQALLANIHASTFAETCGRSVSLGGHAWACVIDHLASPDNETIEIYLTSSDVFLRETRQPPTISGAVATMVSNICVYHFAVIAPDGQRKDIYSQDCRRTRG